MSKTDFKLVHMVGGPMHGQELFAEGYQLIVMRQDKPNAIEKYDDVVVSRVEGSYRFERIPGEEGYRRVGIGVGAVDLYVGVWMGWER